eukprot:6211974-Pleurochrysis_carterae.AAC.4
MAPYSWHRDFRGSTDDLHFAMGFELGNFTCRGLTQGLPLSYGRWVCTSQLFAASMRLNFDLPLFSREELHRNPLLNERVLTSQEEKLALLDIAGPSCDNTPAAATSPSCVCAPTAAAQAEDVEHPVTEESELRSRGGWNLDLENHAGRSDAGSADPLHSRILHCFEGRSGNIVASTYTYSTRTCTDLCTRS